MRWLKQRQISSPLCAWRCVSEGGKAENLQEATLFKLFSDDKNWEGRYCFPTGGWWWGVKINCRNAWLWDFVIPLLVNIYWNFFWNLCLPLLAGISEVVNCWFMMKLKSVEKTFFLAARVILVSALLFYYPKWGVAPNPSHFLPWCKK
jgi:hypothetical protein